MSVIKTLCNDEDYSKFKFLEEYFGLIEINDLKFIDDLGYLIRAVKPRERMLTRLFIDKYLCRYQDLIIKEPKLSRNILDCCGILSGEFCLNIRKFPLKSLSKWLNINSDTCFHYVNMMYNELFYSDLDVLYYQLKDMNLKDSIINLQGNNITWENNSHFISKIADLKNIKYIVLLFNKITNYKEFTENTCEKIIHIHSVHIETANTFQKYSKNIIDSHLRYYEIVKDLDIIL